jgi:hypothetical protein
MNAKSQKVVYGNNLSEIHDTRFSDVVGFLNQLREQVQADPDAVQKRIKTLSFIQRSFVRMYVGIEVKRGLGVLVTKDLPAKCRSTQEISEETMWSEASIKIMLWEAAMRIQTFDTLTKGEKDK